MIKLNKMNMWKLSQKGLVYNATIIGIIIMGMMSIEAERAFEQARTDRLPERPVETNRAQFIKNFEGYRNKGYYATEDEKAQGLVTVGYGSTNRVAIDEEITEQQANEFLQEDLDEAERKVDALVTIDMTDNQRSALVSLLFNTISDKITSLDELIVTCLQLSLSLESEEIIKSIPSSGKSIKYAPPLFDHRE